MNAGAGRRVVTFRYHSSVDPIRFCPACGAKVVTPGPTCEGCRRPLVLAPPPERTIENLRLLAIFHYVVAVVIAIFGCFPLIHLTIGFALVVGSDELAKGSKGGPPPAIVGWMMVVVAGAMIMGFWTLAWFLFLAGRSLSQQKRYTLCIVVACIACLFMPFGTILGVFTLIVLVKPEAKALFRL